MRSAAYRCSLFGAVVLMFFAASVFRVKGAAPDRVSLGSQSRSRSELRFAGAAEKAGSGQRRMREGSTITNTAGHFRQDGDGATFVTDEGLEFGGLANLNLERVARTLKGSDESKSIRWRVSGLITEFAGRNYILVSRAVYKSTAPPPVPERVSNSSPAAGAQ